MVIHWRHERTAIRRIDGDPVTSAYIGADARKAPPGVLSEAKRQQVLTFMATIMAPAIVRVLLLEQERVSGASMGKELGDE